MQAHSGRACLIRQCIQVRSSAKNPAKGLGQCFRSNAERGKVEGLNVDRRQASERLRGLACFDLHLPDYFLSVGQLKAGPLVKVAQPVADSPVVSNDGGQIKPGLGILRALAVCLRVSRVLDFGFNLPRKFQGCEVSVARDDGAESRALLPCIAQLVGNRENGGACAVVLGIDLLHAVLDRLRQLGTSGPRLAKPAYALGERHQSDPAIEGR
jgi:hypothetical protein